MKITIISVGKLKEKYLVEGVKEYTKRLSRYSKIEYVEVKDEQAPENLSLKDIELIKEKESDRILPQIKDSFVISLAIEGTQLSSEELAQKLVQIQTYHNSNITFIIGGSLGLSKTILEQSNLLISFSKMTFPHQLMKVILLEQLYRSFRINNNEPYHK